MSKLDSKIPPGPIEKKWTYHKGHARIVNPANKRRIDIIVVGTGLAGGAAAASLAEQGYSAKAFCFQDSARRAQHRRAGWNQRREEFPERRRQHLPFVLRYRERW